MPHGFCVQGASMELSRKFLFIKKNTDLHVFKFLWEKKCVKPIYLLSPYLLNKTAVSLNNGLNTAPEPGAGTPAHVHVHSGEYLTTPCTASCICNFATILRNFFFQTPKWYYFLQNYIVATLLGFCSFIHPFLPFFDFLFVIVPEIDYMIKNGESQIIRFKDKNVLFFIIFISQNNSFQKYLSWEL